MSPEPIFQIPIGPQGVEYQSHVLLTIVDVLEFDDPVLKQKQHIFQTGIAVNVSDGRSTIATRAADEFRADELAAVTRFLMYPDRSDVAIRGSSGVFELRMSRAQHESVVRVSSGNQFMFTSVSFVSLATSLECVSSATGDDAGLVRSSWTFEEPIPSSEESLSDALRILSEFI